MSTASLPFSGYGYLPFVTYGTRRLTESSPAQSFTEPLSLAEMQDYLKIPVRSPADTAEDALLRPSSREHARQPRKRRAGWN
jgi:hypothetical protein